MHQEIRGERTLMRIFIGERDRVREGARKGRPLHEALLEFFRERGFAGCTVLRGIAGFGASAKVHTTHLLELSLDLPIVLEVVEATEKIEAMLPLLDEMIGGGMVTLEPVRVLIYRPGERPPHPPGAAA